jgi:hypothetical protein
MLGGKANPGADDVKKILGSGACPDSQSSFAAAGPHQPPAAAGLHASRQLRQQITSRLLTLVILNALTQQQSR